MRLVQTRVPADARRDVLDTLEAENIEHIADERGDSDGMILYVPTRRRGTRRSKSSTRRPNTGARLLPTNGNDTVTVVVGRTSNTEYPGLSSALERRISSDAAEPVTVRVQFVEYRQTKPAANGKSPSPVRTPRHKLDPIGVPFDTTSPGQ